MEKTDPASKENLIKYSRYILRRLGHALPQSGWIETYSWPGMQLSAFCRHCKKAFAICGDPNEAAQAARDNSRMSFWKKDWNLIAIVDDPGYETERAWKWNDGPKVRKETICTLGHRDFEAPSAFTAYLFAAIGQQMPQVTEEGPDPDEVVKRKIVGISENYYCPKIRTWL